MNVLGAHISASGGVDKVFERGEELGCDAIQIFTRNQRQWDPKPLSKESMEAFFSRKETTTIQFVSSHASYLINLASPEKSQWERSVDAMVDELFRAHTLSLDAVVVHPGSHKKHGIQFGLERVILAIQEIFDRTGPISPKLLLENTAGQGEQLGASFQELSDILQALSSYTNLGVCIDTAHAFQSGYLLITKTDYENTIKELNDTIGLEHIFQFHLNDSKTEAGSRKDRHENIAQGAMGNKPFEHLMNDVRFRDVPMILETPGGDDCFKENLRLLRSMVRH